ncbi:hypothetical protein JYK21_27665 [Ralstonia pickettii]|nr:hypothetical protein [Ralstonia pickettii]
MNTAAARSTRQAPPEARIGCEARTKSSGNLVHEEWKQSRDAAARRQAPS